MLTSPRAFALLATLLLLAGCVSGKSASDTAPGTSDAPPIGGPAEVSETTGGIEGVVVDESIQPLAGALVGLKDSSVTTTTGPDGKFSFSNLPPGKYVVLANALGYEARAQGVDVAAGAVANARLVLPSLPTAVPYTELKTFSGLIECGWGVSGAGAGNCLPIQFIIQMFGLPNPTNTQIIGLFAVSDIEKAQGGVYEMDWNPAAATTAGQLLLVVELEGTGAIAGKVYNQTQGSSPLRTTTDKAPFKDLKPADGKTKVQTRTFPAATTPPTVVANQRFTVYTTFCYVEMCGDSYTALVDR
jgi:hypothetical protein